jgi:transposase
MVVADGEGLPLGIQLASASPSEVKLIESTLAQTAIKSMGRIERLIYDRAADSDPLRSRLAENGIELICPHRKNRKKARTQDGQKLRRYKRRWKIERSIAWIGNFRRLVVRYERNGKIYQAFVHLACLMITLNRF